MPMISDNVADGRVRNIAASTVRVFPSPITSAIIPPRCSPGFPPKLATCYLHVYGFMTSELYEHTLQ